VQQTNMVVGDISIPSVENTCSHDKLGWTPCDLGFTKVLNFTTTKVGPPLSMENIEVR
jgi:hypothetical protein